MELINKILREISSEKSVIIDLGCGDGFIERNISEVKFKEWHAIDPTELLIKKSKPVGQMFFHIGDSDLLPQLPKPDILFTVRTLINIPNQKREYQKIAKACHSDTKIFFCEASIQGLKKINSARKFFKLPVIAPIQFNKYINEKELEETFEILHIEHFASSYYFGSRIVNALINIKKQNYYDPVNVYFKDIPPFGEWGVHRMFYLKKKIKK
ncbi:MAG: methyltransferase domain-containing protein [Deltaproteobacteria bacterium]|nr:methyltransferase domain-containing protein [Deltaproteobacteria bacterium]